MKEIIEIRRSYRAIESSIIDEKIINELISASRLAPSCFNNQPWRFVFVYDKQMKEKLHEALSKGNEWAFNSSMIIAVFSEKEKDCIVKNREYYLFDTGIASAFMMLRATDLGLVAHPIAGYSESKVKKILSIPERMTVIALIVIGKHSETILNSMNVKEKEQELNRPERLPVKEIAFMNTYTGK